MFDNSNKRNKQYMVFDTVVNKKKVSKHFLDNKKCLETQNKDIIICQLLIKHLVAIVVNNNNKHSLLVYPYLFAGGFCC